MENYVVSKCFQNLMLIMYIIIELNTPLLSSRSSRQWNRLASYQKFFVFI